MKMAEASEAARQTIQEQKPSKRMTKAAKWRKRSETETVVGRMRLEKKVRRARRLRLREIDGEDDSGEGDEPCI